MSAPTIVVTGTYHDASGAAEAADYVTFKLNAELRDAAGDLVVSRRKIRANLDNDGQILDVDGTTVGLTLYCTEGGDIAPDGLVYEVEEHVGGRTNRFFVTLPESLGETVDMADLAPVDDTGVTWAARRLSTLGDVDVSSVADGDTLTWDEDAEKWTAAAPTGGGVTQEYVDDADALLIPLTQKAAANGVATLDSDGKVPAAQIPAIALSEFLGSVNTQAAMLALVGQRGDWAVRTDLTPNRVFILESDDPTQLANWTDITTPGAVISVAGKTGAVTLQAADITDFAAAAIAAVSGTYAPRPAVDGSVGHALKILSLSPLVTEWGVVGGATVDVVSNVAQNRILGRTTAGSGDSEELTAAQVKTLLALAISDTSGLQTALDAKVPLDLSSLTSSAAPDSDDEIYVWLDGTPRRVTLGNIVALAPAGYTDAQARAAVINSTTVAYAATVTPAVASPTEVLNIGALTGNLTLAAPTGTPADGWKLIVRMVQDGTGSRTVTYNSAYAFGTDIASSLDPVTASTKWERVFQWHAGDSKWRAVGIVRGF